MRSCPGGAGGVFSRPADAILRLFPEGGGGGRDLCGEEAGSGDGEGGRPNPLTAESF